MEEENVNSIRNASRDFLNFRRKILRDEISDDRRCIQKQKNAAPITEVVNKLKTKSFVSAAELCQLKNALIDDARNIELVLSTNGVMRGLVRELSGNDVGKQHAAAGCFCNLALGDSKACCTISKAAGPYLLPLLTNLSEELAVTCSWTIGNLAGAGPRVCQVLAAQGILAKLVELFNPDVNHRDEAGEAVLYALTHIAYQMKDELMLQDLQSITQSLSKMQLTSTSLQLLFIISCHENFSMTEDLLHKTLHQLSKCLNLEYKHKKDDINDCIFVIRVLANVQLNDIIFNVIVNYLISNNLSEAFKVALNDERNVLNKPLSWFLGNLLVFSNDSSFIVQLLR